MVNLIEKLSIIMKTGKYIIKPILKIEGLNEIKFDIMRMGPFF